MDGKHFSRRNFIKTSSNMVGCAWLTLSLPAICAATKAASVASANSESFRVLTPAQALIVDAVSAQILPSDGTPGAREASVVYFIDNVLQNEQAQVAEIVTGGTTKLNALAQSQHGKPFVKLASDSQVAMLQQIEETPFFDVMRFLTICGMFSNPSYGGNRDKVGWKLMDFNDSGVWQSPFGYYDAQELKIKG